jgi:hypothetical protein
VVSPGVIPCQQGGSQLEFVIISSKSRLWVEGVHEEMKSNAMQTSASLVFIYSPVPPTGEHATLSDFDLHQVVFSIIDQGLGAAAGFPGDHVTRNVIGEVVNISR